MKKKKILLVTLFDDNNIGNRLQNYALLQVLQSRGVEVTVLNNSYTTYPTIKESVKAKIQGVLGSLGIIKYEQKYQRYVADGKKRKANQKFDDLNIKNIMMIKNKQAFQTDWSSFDAAIAGSDQIWHKWRDDEFELPFYYLQFMPNEKRFAYAASFGFESFPKKDIKQHRDGLNGMKCISCREKSGCLLATEIVGKDIPHVLDPTLLLTASEWRNIAEQASDFAKHQKNYAFIYFLGKQTEKYKNWIKNVMRKEKIENIVDFSDFNNSNICECGPSGFLSLIDHADYVFTDSFHCTVFSILFDKKFTVFRRKQAGFEKMFGRIEDLLASKGKLENIYGNTIKNATNDFDKLYAESMRYIDKILENNS